jgi:hypothetical protein
VLNAFSMRTPDSHSVIFREATPKKEQVSSRRSVAFFESFTPGIVEKDFHKCFGIQKSYLRNFHN